MSGYSGGRAERALSAGERQQGGVDKLRMIDRVRLRSWRRIKAAANPPHRTEEADAATYEEYLVFQRPRGSTHSSIPS